jgi:hypothetical protein
MSHPTPPFAAVIQHRVADFDRWKTEFDAHKEARASASILGHHINRGAEDANMLSVYLPAKDRGALEGMMGSSELKEAMSAAGVEGRPNVKLMAPQSETLVRDRLTAGVIVAHEVNDYDAWRAIYDSEESNRQAAGIVGDAVNRAVENEKEVIVYLQADDATKLREYCESAQLKEAMAGAGVSGPPSFDFVQGSEWGNYA